MIRTQVYLEENAKDELESLAKKRGVAMADLIREGIDAVLAASRSGAMARAIDDIAGMWADRDDIKDAESYVREIRRSSRPIVNVFSETSAKYATHKKKRC